MQIEIGGNLVNVIINRKNNKNTYIKIKDLDIIVNTSKFTRDKEIKRLILENEGKIEALLNKSVKREKEEAKFYYLGVEYDIIIMPSLSEIIFDNGSILVKSEEFLNKFIKKKTNQIFEERYNYVYSIFDEEIPNYRLRSRKMKTRWGVCNKSSKTITLNSKLIRYDKSIIDYVIIHELCHLIHFDHSKNFWELVYKYDRDYKRHRKILKG